MPWYLLVERLPVTRLSHLCLCRCKKRVDDLSKKVVSFSRALVRAQQVLNTCARIAREAATGFDTELENFILAQRDLDRKFQTQP